MQTAEFDHNEFAVGREAEADKHLMVKFFMREKQDKTESAKQGRPIYKDVEYVEIRVPGKRDALACRPATHQDKTRFPRHYEAFKQRTELPQEGTPLSQWPEISRSMAEELSFLKVKTVEQLIAMSDNDAGQIRGGLGLKQRAKAFLESADSAALAAEKVALEARLAEQDGQIAELKGMVSELMLELKAAKSTEVTGNPEPEPETPEPETAKVDEAPAEIDTEAEPPAEAKPRRRRSK